MTDTLAGQLPFGLITPPYDMQPPAGNTYPDPSAYTTATGATSNTASGVQMNPNNIPAPPSNSRYNLRKHHLPSALHPSNANNNYPNVPYNLYVQVRQPSAHPKTTAAASGTSSLAYPGSPTFDFDSPDFNVAEFTANMTCFLWFESLPILEYAEASTEQTSQLYPLSDDYVPALDFVEFCARVIRTTAVSNEVALLGLLFIYRYRLKNPEVVGKIGSHWRIFTVALMLGNKILDDNTYTNKTWADVTKIHAVEEIKIIEVEFLTQLRYNLFVSPQQWDEWKAKASRMYMYHRECLRSRSVSKKGRPSNVPLSPPVSSTSTSPSFPDSLPYIPMSTSPFRSQIAQQPIPERLLSPDRSLSLMEDSPLSASTAVHARVSRKRSREDNNPLPSGLQPPNKRYHQQYPQPPSGIQIPSQPQQRLHYVNEVVQPFPQTVHKRPSLAIDPSQTSSPSYSIQQNYPAQTTSPPSFPASPFAVSPLSPYSTASNFNSLSPYSNVPHRPMPGPSTPQQGQVLDAQPVATGYVSGYSSPYKYLQNRFSPYAPVCPARTLPSQFNPPRMKWNMIPPMASEELWYQPIGQHGHSGLRRGIPEYNPGYQFPSQHQHQHQQQQQ